jgi:predicted PurR-regulated permease PerM
MFLPHIAPPAREVSDWALPVLAGLASVAALWAARELLIPLVVALTLAVLLWPAMRLMERVVRSRAVAALVVVLATLAGVGVITVAVGTQLSAAADSLPSVLRLAAKDVASLGTDRAQAMQRTRSALVELDRSVARATGTDRAVPVRDGEHSGSIVTTVVDTAGTLAINASKSAAGVLLQVGVIALLAFFLLCSAEALTAGALRWCRAGWPGVERCQSLLAQTSHQVRLFAGVTMVTNVAIGLGVAAGFALFGVPQAWMWGLAAAALHGVPYIGMVVVMGLAALEVYLAQSSLGAALAAAAYVAAVGGVIGTAVSVWLQGRAARVDGATLFAGTLFWSFVWGAWGLVLGPLLVVMLCMVLSEAKRAVLPMAELEPAAALEPEPESPALTA